MRTRALRSHVALRRDVCTMPSEARRNFVDDDDDDDDVPTLLAPSAGGVGSRALSRCHSVACPPMSMRPSGLTQPRAFHAPQPSSRRRSASTTDDDVDTFDASSTLPLTFSLVSKQKLAEFRSKMYRHHTFSKWALMAICTLCRYHTFSK